MQGLIDERGLARARHARNHRQRTERERHVNVLQVVALCSSYGKAFWSSLVIYFGTDDFRLLSFKLLLTVQVLCREGIGLHQFLGSTLEHHLATFPSSLRSDVDNIVGSKHHVLVVFHYDYGVAQVSQLLQRIY